MHVFFLRMGPTDHFQPSCVFSSIIEKQIKKTIVLIAS